jgi:aconitate hydratase
MFRKRYANVFAGPAKWQSVKTAEGLTYHWAPDSTYVKLPPLFESMPREPQKIGDIKGARLLGLFGDSITTDHISPAGDIKKSSPAGKYLIEHNVPVSEFNSYGARRGNHEVMMRGTFANIRIKNELMGGAEGGNTKHFPSGDSMSIYEAAMRYQKERVPLVVIAGKEYGTGSSRDWAAKGTKLLGVGAVVAESFERIHRSNLVGMSVLPLVFKNGMTRADVKLTGMETFDITGIAGGIKPRMDVTLTIHRPDGKSDLVTLLCRIDTLDEVEYYKNGGILPFVLRDLIRKVA